MAASTLVQIRDAIELDLKDSTNLTWSTAELDEHIRRALREVSRIKPQVASTTMASVADTWEYSLAAITGLERIVDVWYPWDATHPEEGTKRPRWTMLYDGYLKIDQSMAMTGDALDTIRIIYTKPHTIKDLDSAAAGTLDAQQEQLVILGATAFAVQQKAQDDIGAVTVSGWTPVQYLEWSKARIREYDRVLKQYQQRCVMEQDSVAAIEGEV